MSPYYYKNIKLITDNAYSSVPLALELLKKKVYLTGTLRSNRLFLPKEVSKPPRLNRGQYIMFQAQNYRQLSVVVWKDTKECRFISTHVSPLKESFALRRVARNHERYPQPLVAHVYAQHFTAVDRSNQHRQYYNIGPRSRKYWKYLWYYLLQTTIVNAWALYEASNIPHNKKSYSQLDFRLDLAKELINGFTCRKQSLPNRKLIISGPNAPPPVDLAGHKCERLSAKSTKLCTMHKKFTSQKKRTVFGCKKCGNITLCKSCFLLVHNKN